MDPNDFCECLGFDNNVVPDAELDRSGVDDVMNGRVVSRLKQRDSVVLGEPISGKL